MSSKNALVTYVFDDVEYDTYLLRNLTPEGVEMLEDIHNCDFSNGTFEPELKKYTEAFEEMEKRMEPLDGQPDVPVHVICHLAVFT